MKILVTGCAGFIGSNLVDRLLADGHEVVGIDNFNDYYDPGIKEKNLEKARGNQNFILERVDLLSFEDLEKVFIENDLEVVIHLAARAGVRPSINNPQLYSEVNVLGTVNLLKLSSQKNIRKFILGSSSSVYGNSSQLPFAEDDPCDDLASVYAASKRAAEFFAESFWHSYSLKVLILRFFTVYGPRGRVDMAPSLFTTSILKGDSLNMFGTGDSSRDYTYIDDIVDGIIKGIKSDFNFEIVNLGNSKPVSILKFINLLEKIIGARAKIKKLPMQNGDVAKTWASGVKARKLLSWKPKTNLVHGLENYVRWQKGQS